MRKVVLLFMCSDGDQEEHSSPHEVLRATKIHPIRLPGILEVLAGNGDVDTEDPFQRELRRRLLAQTKKLVVAKHVDEVVVIGHAPCLVNEASFAVQQRVQLPVARLNFEKLELGVPIRTFVVDSDRRFHETSVGTSAA